VYLIGAKIQPNYFEMHNIDMCFGDAYNKDTRSMTVARKQVMDDCKEHGKLASIPWKYQFGSWFKNFDISNP